MEGLDMEMELCSGMINELQAKLDSYEGNTTSQNKGAAPLDEKMTFKALSELGAGEAAALLSSMMEYMVEAKARAWELENDVKRKGCSEEGLRIDKRRLERRLSASARGFEQRLVELKCQHQQDLITLVRGTGAASGRIEVAMAGKNGNNTAKQEGSMEEEEEDKADQVAKRQLEALVSQNDTLEARCQALSTELDTQKAEMTKLAEDAEAARKEAKELRDTNQVGRLCE